MLASVTLVLKNYGYIRGGDRVLVILAAGSVGRRADMKGRPGSAACVTLRMRHVPSGIFSIYEIGIRNITVWTSQLVRNVSSRACSSLLHFNKFLDCSGREKGGKVDLKSPHRASLRRVARLCLPWFRLV